EVRRVELDHQLLFLSSRRRHTRFSRDWSSDVCSSDLSLAIFLSGCRRPIASSTSAVAGWSTRQTVEKKPLCWAARPSTRARSSRSEERREGKRVDVEGSSLKKVKKRRCIPTR